jgi:hypothetical protein
VARAIELATSRTADEHFYKILHAALLERERLPAVWHPHLLAMTRLYGPSTSTALCKAWQLVVGAP